jgi:hypothetical protein
MLPCAADSFLAQAQASQLSFLHGINPETLSPDAQNIGMSVARTLSMQLTNNIDILSTFMRAMAVEHADDVNDPREFLRMFRLEPDISKDD